MSSYSYEKLESVFRQLGSTQMIYTLPSHIVDFIERHLRTETYCFMSARSFGEKGRVYFYKDGALYTRLMNRETNLSIPLSEMLVKRI